MLQICPWTSPPAIPFTAPEMVTTPPTMLLTVTKTHMKTVKGQGRVAGARKKAGMSGPMGAEAQGILWSMQKREHSMSMAADGILTGATMSKKMSGMTMAEGTGMRPELKRMCSMTAGSGVIGKRMDTGRQNSMKGGAQDRTGATEVATKVATGELSDEVEKGAVQDKKSI